MKNVGTLVLVGVLLLNVIGCSNKEEENRKKQ